MDGQLTTTSTTRPAYTVRVVADRLGVPVPTLRSWTRRYGIGPGEHEPGTHRTYTDADIAVLERMVALIASGASPSSAAAAARDGRTRPLDVGAVVDAAHRLDAAELLRLIGEQFTAHGVVTTWESLCRPAFAAIVHEQTTVGGCVDVEHVLSWAVLTCLHRVPVAAAPVRIVLACAEDELHTLPLEVLRAALAERDIESVVLGSAPPEAVTDALGRATRPVVAVLWANSADTADHRAQSAAHEAGARVFVAGPGWEQDEALRTLAAAIDAIAAAVSAS